MLESDTIHGTPEDIQSGAIRSCASRGAGFRLIYLDAATDFALDDPEHPLLTNEMNDIKRRIEEIEAGGVDEKKDLLGLEAAVARFETVLHHDNAGLANMPPLPPRSPIGAALKLRHVKVNEHSSPGSRNLCVSA